MIILKKLVHKKLQKKENIATTKLNLKRMSATSKLDIRNASFLGGGCWLRANRAKRRVKTQAQTNANVLSSCSVEINTSNFSPSITEKNIPVFLKWPRKQDAAGLTYILIVLFVFGSMGIFCQNSKPCVCLHRLENYRRATDTQALRRYLENKMTVMILEAECVKSR